MEEIKVLFLEIMTPALQQLILGLVGILMIWLGRKVGTILDTDTERKLAMSVVQAVDLIGAKLNWTGTEKKQEALFRLSAELKAKHINVSAETLDLLVESMVKAFKYGYGPMPIEENANK